MFVQFDLCFSTTQIKGFFLKKMLKKRNRSIQKDQQMGPITSDGGVGGYETCLQSKVIGQRQKINSFFNVPGLFVGLTPNVASDCDSVRSPTSPLDFKLFCNLGNCLRLPKSSNEDHQKCWDCQKVGLGSIVDSLDDDDDDDVDDRNLTEKSKIIPSSNCKTILFGSQIKSKGVLSPKHADFCEAPKSLPKNYPIFPRLRPSYHQKGTSDVLFEIGGEPLESDPFRKIQSFSLDSHRLEFGIHRLNDCNTESMFNRSCFGNGKIERTSSCSPIGVSPMPITNGNEILCSLTPAEIELSEDYTCVITHGTNPKTTHIFGDCVLNCHPNEIDLASLETRKPCLENCLQKCSTARDPSDDFFSFCHFCKKKLEEGKDIYIGEKAFCSWDCRLEEISIDGEQEKFIMEAHGESPKPENGDDVFEKSIFVAI
ncbi:FCS-Like Zinc finger 10-like isoform X1 [Amaranthus tricolor]|uniref:FCS-Like Zinc finger 10-like isoform X1 n=1 Tax=Amaranthus tricolor TaxID=29722 RepID=UPI00258D3DF9|nr:FCS-Like Zinc finger 10-like isoform X1 [Amaranthus tricolor]